MTTKPASRTAVLVCQARAVADDRLGIGRFRDPIAAHLLRKDERVPVERARNESAPDGLRVRLEAMVLDATTAVLVSRTVVIDDAVRAKANPQLVVLGAGLDARAYRLPELGDVDVYEVDHPASQHDKRDRIDGLQPVAKSLTHVPVDFGHDPLGPALAAAGHDAATPTTWIWEGVVPYLTEAAVRATLTAIGERSAAGSRLIVTYPTPNRLTAIGGRVLRVATRVVGARDPLQDEPHISTWQPEAIRALTAEYGFTVIDDHELMSVAQRLDLPTRQSRLSRLGRVAVADKQPAPQ
ncbi:class I SAM-dependent methyltransferase [Nocardia sp. CA-120079]|uniref:class I SAM-dependent methyltransferase n=1 Tax=Nocardia sp. CA-120079 TaxID=3239974 RepID=UPI003D970816